MIYQFWQMRRRKLQCLYGSASTSPLPKLSNFNYSPVVKQNLWKLVALWFFYCKLLTTLFKRAGAQSTHPSKAQTVKMMINILVSLLCLVPGLSAAPQQSFQGLLGGGGLADILKNPVIQKRILENNLNPCDHVDVQTVKASPSLSTTKTIPAQEMPGLTNAPVLMERLLRSRIWLRMW